MHTLNRILIKNDKQGYLSQFVTEMFEFYSKILLEVLRNMSLTIFCYHGNILGSRPPRY